VRLLFVGDIFGKPGRRAVERFVPSLRDEHKIDFCIANGENAAAGKGLTPDLVKELTGYGIDVLTGGNHIWHQKDIIPFMGKDDRVLRPINFPPKVPGKGSGIYSVDSKTKIAVISAMGRIFMRELDNPFYVIEKEVLELKKKTPIIFVDFHAEATSEKVAMGWFLDGTVSAVIGTHTHIPTADERILPEGTAYMTDCGMTGPFDSVIGVKKEVILEMFLTQMPTKHEVASGDVRLCAVIIDIDEATGKSKHIERIQLKLND
jgi:metallophosphoesterase (TIGR00282 family)